MTDERWVALNKSITGALKQVAWQFDEGVNEFVIADVADELTDILVSRWMVRPD